MAASPAPTYALRLALAAEGGVCLWAENEAARRRFGYAVGLKQLPLSGAVKAQAAALIERYEEATAGQLRKTSKKKEPPALFGYPEAATAYAADVAALAAALRAELGAEFALTHEPAAPPAFAAGWNRNWTLIAAPAALVMAALSLWLATAIALRGFGDMAPFGRVLLAAMFAAFGLVFVFAAFTYALASRDTSTVVAIDGDGIFDARLSKARIPWDAIAATAQVSRAQGGGLAVALKTGRRAAMPQGPLWFVNRLAASVTRPTPLVVKPTGLTAPINDIVTAALAHQPPAGPS
ncbi:MAG: hypothetical protein U1E56_01650 [Bauldia sp.]